MIFSKTDFESKIICSKSSLYKKEIKLNLELNTVLENIFKSFKKILKSFFLGQAEK